MSKTTLFVEKTKRELVTIGLLLSMFAAAFTPLPVSAQSSESSATTEESSESSNETEKETEGSNNPGNDEDSESSNDDDDTDEKKSSSDSETKEPEEPVLTVENLPEKLNSILENASSRSDWGVKVVLNETGETLFESQADEGFIPASNRKLFTGALALDQLGPDHVFRTYLYKTGTVDAQGTLNGNLVIVPSGDPTFSTKLFKAPSSDWVYRDWAEKVKAAGIKNITGDLLVDCSGWDMNDMTPYGWPSRVLNDGYAPQTSPLTINANLTNIILTPGKDGEPASVSYAPAATGYPVVNKTESGKKGSPVAKRVVNSHIEIRGGVPSKKTIWSFPIDRPTLYAAANFRHHLHEKDVPIQGSVRIITTSGFLPGPTAENIISLVESPKLIEIVDYMMKRSDNHMAEQLYVAVSNAKLGMGSYGNSWRLEADLLTRAGIDPRGIQSKDGSGLSEENRVTPTDVCKLLTYMRQHPYSQQYYDSMAVSGREGTLRNRMGRIAGKVHAKTGTINGVKTLSGYLMLAPDKTISFSFLVNDIKGGSPSTYQDRMCTTLAALVL